MITFLVTTLIIMLALGLVSYLSSKRSNVSTDQTSALSLLPGDDQVRKSTRGVHLLLSDHNLDCDQHHPNAGPLSVTVIAQREHPSRR
jgi:hypothetical protein